MPRRGSRVALRTLFPPKVRTRSGGEGGKTKRDIQTWNRKRTIGKVVPPYSASRRKTLALSYGNSIWRSSRFESRRMRALTMTAPPSSTHSRITPVAVGVGRNINICSRWIVIIFPKAKRGWGRPGSLRWGCKGRKGFRSMCLRQVAERRLSTSRLSPLGGNAGHPPSIWCSTGRETCRTRTTIFYCQSQIECFTISTQGSHRKDVCNS